MVGKTDAAYLQAGMAIYEKRLPHYTPFSCTIIPELKNTQHLSAEEVKRREGELLLKEIISTDYVVLLDEGGKTFTSLQFAAQLEQWAMRGTKQIKFICGGAYGFSEAVYQRANEKLSLSAMTFSHQLVRLLFLEQLYRGYTILRNEPYHHQ